MTIQSDAIGDNPAVLSFLFEAEVRDPQVACIVPNDAFNVLREAARGLGLDVEGQCDLCAADAIEFAQDRLRDIADLRRRTVGVERHLRWRESGLRFARRRLCLRSQHVR